ncbi:MAG: alpha/beta fold hydrolase [Geminicoccales bacterium]
MQIRRVQVEGESGSHDLSFTDWGAPDAARTVVCVHGLTRNGRDFDHLAAALSADARVICPDIIGRGRSDRLADPEQYALPTYIAHMIQLIERLGLGDHAAGADQRRGVDWVGTSMGGLIGMALAAQKDAPVAKLVLNDAGPVVAKVALERIGQYLGKAPSFPSVAAAEQVVRATAAPFGPHTDAEWRFLTEVVLRKNPDGSWRFHYDPKIAEPYRQQMPDKDLEMWPLWDAVSCPTLVIRGAQSDLLSRETAQAMTQRGPKAKLVELPGIGHAPTLLHRDQIALVAEFLTS